MEVGEQKNRIDHEHAEEGESKDLTTGWLWDRVKGDQIKDDLVTLCWMPRKLVVQQKINKLGQAWWLTQVILVFWEVGGSPEVKSLRQAWPTW